MNIIDKAEVLDTENRFLRSQVIFRDGKHFYKGITRTFRPDEIDETNVATLEKIIIPHDHIFPSLVTNLTIFKSNDVGQVYMKVPDLSSYDVSDIGKLPARFLQEAQVLEVMSKHPHPNVVNYLGCASEYGRLVSICLERCLETLYERTWLKEKKVDNENVVASVRSAIEHIHGLGYVHNDISLSNIMFREDDSVVIVDFDSCQRIGEPLGSKKGTPYYFDESTTISKPENDFYSLGKVEAYLQTGKLR